MLDLSEICGYETYSGGLPSCKPEFKLNGEKAAKHLPFTLCGPTCKMFREKMLCVIIKGQNQYNVGYLSLLGYIYLGHVSFIYWIII